LEATAELSSFVYETGYDDIPKPIVQKAKLARVQYQNALHLFPQTEAKWEPKVLTCSSIEKKGISEIWETIKEYETHTRNNGYFENNRLKQSKYWLFEAINSALKERFYDDKLVKTELRKLEVKIEKNEISSFVAATQLLDIYFQKK